MTRMDHLKQKLAEIEKKLEDAEGRMPAHSVKPGQMAALFQLEEERDALASEIHILSEKKQNRKTPMTPPEAADISILPLTHARLAVVAKNTGSDFDGHRLQLPFFGTYHCLTPTEVYRPDGHRLSNKIHEILVNYVANYPSEPPTEGDPVSYRELKDAGPLVVSFANNTLKTITAAFTGKLNELESAARSLGGRTQKNITGYDLCIEFIALPGIPLTLQFNDAQAPFPAQCSLLLDASIETYLDMQAIFGLGTFLCGRLVASAYK